jgi:hypothetical protein
MEFGIFNLMGSRDPEKPTAEVFAEVAEQTRLADELGYAIAWSWAFSSKCRSSAVRTGLAAGGRRIRTCMGLLLSSGCFRFIASSLFGAGKPFFVL